MGVDNRLVGVFISTDQYRPVLQFDRFRPRQSWWLLGPRPERFAGVGPPQQRPDEPQRQHRVSLTFTPIIVDYWAATPAGAFSFAIQQPSSMQGSIFPLGPAHRLVGIPYRLKTDIPPK